ncbi:MAG: putative lipoprotein [Acidimicrobiales bacterium]|nr:putative lipoprotein [Acidimicrobiales bacterium]
MRCATRSTRALAVLVVATLALASCGKKSSSSSNTSASDSAAATTAAPAASQTSTTAGSQAMALTTKKHAKLGSILADAKGATVYTLTNNGSAVACDATCAKVWPPVIASGTATPAGPTGVKVGAEMAGSTRIVTAGGLPVYRFVQDKDSGDAYGDGITSFGGTWHVVKVGAQASAPTTTPTTMRSGY